MDTGGMFAGYILKVNPIAFTREGKQEWLGQSPRGHLGDKRRSQGRTGRKMGLKGEPDYCVFSWNQREEEGRSLVSGRLSRFDVGKSHAFSHHNIIDDLGERAFSREEQSS